MSNQIEWADITWDPRTEEVNQGQRKIIYVCSQGDLFLEPQRETLKKIFEKCDKNPQHNYLFLTKNPEGYREAARLIYQHEDINNLWFGVKAASRDDIIKANRTLGHMTEKFNKFIVLEPLQGNLQIFLPPNIYQWIIMGAAPGTPGKYKKTKKEWIREIMRFAKNNRTPLFMRDNLEEETEWGKKEGEALTQEWPIKMLRHKFKKEKTENKQQSFF